MESANTPDMESENTAESMGAPKKWISMVRVKPLMKDEIININEK